MHDIPEEAVKAAQNAIRTTNWEYGITDADMAKALTAALPFLPVQVAVKKLEWRGTDGVWAKADALFGATYRITEYAGMKEPFKLETVGFVGPNGHYETIEDAKAAAQADFDARILSALEPSAARELALEEIIALCKDYAEDSQPDSEYRLACNDIIEALQERRALSSPDHADAGKVEGDGWMPIESAPKDGTLIDLWSDEYGRLTDCYWGAPMAYEGGETGWVHAHSNEWAESPDEFVHWRPLPLPPVKGGQNG